VKGAIKLEEVHYIVSSMTKNLVSIGAFIDIGHHVIFLKQYYWIVDANNYIVASV